MMPRFLRINLSKATNTLFHVLFDGKINSKSCRQFFVKYNLCHQRVRKNLANVGKYVQSSVFLCATRWHLVRSLVVKRSLKPYPTVYDCFPG